MPGSHLAKAGLVKFCHGRRVGSLSPRSDGPTADRPFISLERAIGLKAGADGALWRSGAFTAGVYPDLPAVTSLQQLFQAPRRFTQQQKESLLHRIEGVSSTQTSGNSGKLHVQTVAAQVRSKGQIRQQLIAAAERTCENGRPGALLLLSGSHPARKILHWTGWCADAFGMLRTAHSMRDTGLLPKHTGIWAVENPLINSPARLKQKIDAGAEVVLTQPPLLWPAFERWMEGVARADLASQSQLVVGIPMLTSANSLQFWLMLCGASTAHGATSLLHEFERHDADSKDARQAFYQQWTAELISKVNALPGVAGLHVMPVTAAGRAQALGLIKHNQLGLQGTLQQT